MKVVIFTGSVDNVNSGPYQAALNLQKGFYNYKVESVVIVGEGHGNGNDIIGLDILFKFKLFYKKSSFVRLYSLVKECDLLMIEGVWFSTILWFYLFGVKNKKVIVSVHGNFNPFALAKSKWRKRLFLLLFRQFFSLCHFRVLSPDERDFTLNILSRYFCRPRSVFLSSNPVCNEYNKTDLSLLQHQIIFGKKYFLYLGRLDPIKGIDRLLKLWSKSDLRTNLNLIIAGSGDNIYVNELKNITSDPSVLFIGPVSGSFKAELFINAEVTILLSYSEGFPMTVLESLSFNTPVIISSDIKTSLLENLPGVKVLNDAADNSCLEALYRSISVKSLNHTSYHIMSLYSPTAVVGGIIEKMRV